MTAEPRDVEGIRSPADIDRLVEQLSVQNFRPIRSELYAALSELRQQRGEVERLSAELADAREQLGSERLVHALQEQRLSESGSFKGAPRWDEDPIVIENDWLDDRCGRCGEALPKSDVEQFRTQLSEAVKASDKNWKAAVEERRRSFAAERALEAVRALCSGVKATPSVETFAAAVRAALSAASPTTSDEPRPVEGCPCGVEAEHGPHEYDLPTASDEPARCDHGLTEGHDVYRPDSGTYAGSCPGPAASGTPETTR